MSNAGNESQQSGDYLSFGDVKDANEEDWHHIVFRRSPSLRLRTYVDGRLIRVTHPVRWCEFLMNSVVVTILSQGSP